MNKALPFFPLFAAWVLCSASLAQSSQDVEQCAKASGDDETIAACTRAITSGQASSSDLANTFYNRGTAWENKGDYDRAIADFNEAIRLNNPQYADAYNNRGNAWNNKDDYDRAIADYNEAIRLNPKYALAYNNRGIAWDRKGDYDRAIADYNEAIRLNPKYAHAYRGRGATRFAQGQFQSAETDFSEALRLNPSGAYLVIWRYFAQSRADHRAAAASELATNAAKVDKAKWPAPIIDLLAGRTDADGVLKAAASSDQKKQRDQLCEAAFFVGEWYLLLGRRPEARASLERAGRECAKNSLEYFSASPELKRLSQ